MKRPAMWLVCAALACLNSWASAAESGSWEVNGDIGGSFADNPKMEGRGEMDINPGFTMNVGLNYHIADWVKVGPSFGFEFNFIDSFGNFEPNSDAELFQLPMLFNVTLEPPQDWVVKPFVGAGVGGNLGILSSRYGYYYDYYYYDYGEYDSDADFSFAWQLSAGVRWQLGENWSLGLVYHFLNTEGQSWSFHDFRQWADVEFDVDVDRIQMHLFAIHFTHSF